MHAASTASLHGDGSQVFGQAILLVSELGTSDAMGHIDRALYRGRIAQWHEEGVFAAEEGLLRDKVIHLIKDWVCSGRGNAAEDDRIEEEIEYFGWELCGTLVILAQKLFGLRTVTPASPEVRTPRLRGCRKRRDLLSFCASRALDRLAEAVHGHVRVPASAGRWLHAAVVHSPLEEGFEPLRRTNLMYQMYDVPKQCSKVPNAMEHNTFWFLSFRTSQRFLYSFSQKRSMVCRLQIWAIM